MKRYAFALFLLLSGMAALWWKLRDGTRVSPAASDKLYAVLGATNGSGVAQGPRRAEQFDPEASRLWHQIQSSNLWKEIPVSRRALEEIAKDRKWLWRRPIDFYGIVIDERGKPVEAAEVQCEWSDESKTGVSKTSVLTDGNGKCELTGRVGYGLTVTARKHGYYTPVDGRLSLNYAEPWDSTYHEPDPQRPVILTLRKKGVPAELVRRRHLRYVAAPGQTSFRLDLLGQRVSATDWDLEWTFQHGPEVMQNDRRSFDWTVTLRAREGGILPHQDEFPFEAPEEGYLIVLQKEMKSAAPDWDGRFEGQCYFKSRDGRVYGRIRFSLAPFPKFGPPELQVHEYYLNPQGDRNLEPAPNLEVNEKYRKPESPDGR